MGLLKTPLVIVGLLLTLIGLGNVYTGTTKAAEYEKLLATERATPPEPRKSDSPRLEPRLRNSLLKNLAEEDDRFAAARAKLDFDRVVHDPGQGAHVFEVAFTHVGARRLRIVRRLLLAR